MASEKDWMAAMVRVYRFVHHPARRRGIYRPLTDRGVPIRRIAVDLLHPVGPHQMGEGGGDVGFVDLPIVVGVRGPRPQPAELLKVGLDVGYDERGRVAHPGAVEPDRHPRSVSSRV
jgi:hypothetical protein